MEFHISLRARSMQRNSDLLLFHFPELLRSRAGECFKRSLRRPGEIRFSITLPLFKTLQHPLLLRRSIKASWPIACRADRPAHNDESKSTSSRDASELYVLATSSLGPCILRGQTFSAAPVGKTLERIQELWNLVHSCPNSNQIFFYYNEYHQNVNFYNES